MRTDAVEGGARPSDAEKHGDLGDSVVSGPKGGCQTSRYSSVASSSKQPMGHGDPVNVSVKDKMFLGY
jgi:hypothetical protein